MTKSKIILYIIVAISLTFRINFEIVNADMGNDKINQLCATKNLLNGNNLSSCEANSKNITEIKCNFLNKYPPGYSLLIIPFYYIAGNFSDAGIMIDIISIVLLFIAILKLFDCLQIQLKNQILIFIFFAFSYTPFYHLTSTDLISLTLFQWALYYTFYYFKNNIKLVKHSLLTGFLLFLTCFFRYSYYPLMFALPFAVLIIGFFTKQKNVIRFAIISGSIAIVFLIIQTLIINYLSGSPYLNMDEVGFFLNNLKRLDVFPFKSFFFYEGFLKVLYKSHPFFKPIYILGTSFFSFFILFEIFRMLFRNKKIDNLIKYYLVTGIIVLAANVLFLSYLSIRHKAQAWQDPPWTFVEETRYYSQSMLFLEIVIFAFILLNQYTNKVLRFLYKLFVYFILFIAVVYWLNNSYNIYIKKDKRFTYKGENSERLQISEFVKAQTSSNNYTVFMSPNTDNLFMLNNFIFIYTNVNAILNDYNGFINNEVINSERPTTLFIAVFPDKDEINKKFSNYSPEKIAEFKSCNLYKIELK